jgi:alpha-1,2-mannosyltransferase
VTDVATSRPNPWLLTALGLGLMAAVVVVVCRPWDLVDGFMIGAPIGRDFANMWLGGRLALDGQLNLLIELPAYKELFSRVFAHNPEDTFVFSYPPHSLLLLAPFAALPFTVAVLLWTAVNLACIAWAARLLAYQTTVQESGPPLALLACLSPAALTMAAFGHFGGMLGLLAVYFFIRADSRPILAGACLALTSIKPQFAVMFGILLIITGRWRVVLWSMPATLILVALSVLALGIQPWVNFVTWTVPFHGQLVSGTRLAALGMVISPYAGLLLLDAPG